MVSSDLECPTCGAPARDAPVDPRAPIACRFCGARFERVTAEAVLGKLKDEIGAWLQKTAGVPAGGSGPTSVDPATRSFLFNDRMLPSLRRDVRRALDEQVGDVLGAPILVPQLLVELAGFRAEDGVLISRREQIMGLRGLKARLESDEVTGFATSAADRMALGRLRADIEHAQLASNAAFALNQGLASGQALARTNLEALSAAAGSVGALEAAADPAASVFAHAVKSRGEALGELLSALDRAPPDAAGLERAASRLDETAHWLLTHECRSLRTALASTGLVRDATAARVIAAVVRATEGSRLAPLAVLDALAVLAWGLSEVTRPRDAAHLVFAWTKALAVHANNGALPFVSDTAWVQAAAASARKDGEQIARVDLVAAPFWVFPVRHAKAEGIFFVSGHQYDGIALVPASTTPDATQLLPAGDPLGGAIQQAVSAPSPPPMPIDVARIGPEAARLSARSVLRGRDLRNVALGEGVLVYVPVAMTELVSARGERRTVALGPRGPMPYEPAHVMARTQALAEARRRL